MAENEAFGLIRHNDTTSEVDLLGELICLGIRFSCLERFVLGSVKKYLPS